MRVELTGRHVEITAPLRQLIDRRLAKLERLLNDSVVSAQVILTREKYRHLSEVVIHARGDHILRGTGQGNNWPLSMRQAAQKIEQQAQKLKGKWTEGKRQGVSASKAASAAPRPERGAAAFGTGLSQREDGAPQMRIIRARRYAVKPMSVDEAAMEVVDGRDTFLVFRNSRTEEINVLFRRSDGNLGLIEPEA